MRDEGQGLVTDQAERGRESLPEWLRRERRFGDRAAADLAELAALRREIDGISARLARSLAADFPGRRPDPGAPCDIQAAFLQLRAAGLALLAEIEQRTPQP